MIVRNSIILILGLCYYAQAQWAIDYTFSPIGSQSITSITAIDSSTIWILTRPIPDSGRIYRKVNSSVEQLNSGGFFNPVFMKAVGYNAAYIQEYPHILHFTSNSGINWVTRFDTASVISFSYFADVKKPNYICIAFGDAALQSKFLKSTDYGATWSERNMGLVDLNFVWDVRMRDTSHFYAGVTCQNSTCTQLSYSYSNNGGNTWQLKPFPLVSNNTIIIAPVFDVYNQVGVTFSIGYYYYRYRSSDGGQNWSNPEYFSLGNTENLSGILNVDSTPIWLCATANTIFESRNNGANWQSMTIPLTSDENINCFDVYKKGNKYYGYLGSSKGVIYKLVRDTGVIGIRQISSSIPLKCELKQNFPNPFNPVTIIGFDIAQTMKPVKTRLTIYDELGRLIETIVDDQLMPGSYQYEWNAANLPTGVYFCSILSGNFKDTKKLVLTK